MHHLENHRLAHQLQRFAGNLAPAPAAPADGGSTHDMLVMSSRPDLTPGFPPAFKHPTQTDFRPNRSNPRT
jgi:hypothetical protein